MSLPVDGHAPAFKAKVALAALTGDRPLAQIARQFNVRATDVSRWRRHLLRHASEVLAATQTGVSAKEKKRKPQGSLRAAVTRAAHPVHSFSRSVVYWGRILETLYNRQFVRAMGPMRISVSFWRILSWLTELGTLTVGEIAAHSQIERTVLSRLLERMAREGLITRVPRRGDRRISETRITSKGRAAVRAIRPVRHQVYTHATRGIEPQHLDFVCEVIIKMIDNLGGHQSLFPPE